MGHKNIIDTLKGIAEDKERVDNDNNIVQSSGMDKDTKEKAYEYEKALDIENPKLADGGRDKDLGKGSDLKKKPEKRRKNQVEPMKDGKWKKELEKL